MVYQQALMQRNGNCVLLWPLVFISGIIAAGLARVRRSLRRRTNLWLWLNFGRVVVLDLWLRLWLRREFGRRVNLGTRFRREVNLGPSVGLWIGRSIDFRG